MDCLGYASRPPEDEHASKGGRREDQREALRRGGLRIWQGDTKSSDPWKARAAPRSQTAWYVYHWSVFFWHSSKSSTPGSDIGKELEGPKPKDAAKAKESAKAEIESKSKGAAAPKAKDTSKADSGTKPKAKDAGKRKDTPKSNDAANAEDVQKPEKTP
jgi:lipopolysaccharide biosynthesis glycosyltransferase